MSSLTSITAAVVAAGLLVSGSAQAQAPDPAPNDLSLLPVDSELVGGLDFQQLQSSALWNQLVVPLLAKNDFQKSMAEFQTQCGVDPMTVVTRIAIGLKGIGDPMPEGVVVAHGVPKAKLVACYEKLAKKRKNDVTVDGDVLITKGDKGPVAFAFVDDSTAIIVIGSKATGPGTRALAKGGSALKSSAPFLDIYRKTNTSDTVWMILNGSTKALDPLAKAGIRTKAIYGSLNVTQDLSLDVKARMTDAATAESFAKVLKSQTAGAAKLVDQISITSTGPEVTFTALITNAKLKTLIQQVTGGTTASPPSRPASSSKPLPPPPPPTAKKPTPACDEVGCVLDNYDRACCAKYKKK